MKTPNITITNASLAYDQIPVFSALDLHLPAGKWVGLLGPSGIGKSSLLRLLAGLTTPNEQVYGTINTDNSKPLNEQIAYMGQTDLLLPWLTTQQNVTLSFKLQTTNELSASDYTAKATTLLNQVGLSHVLDHYPHQLSGGMRQRAALARTLIQEKPIVLMDEPFSALDAITRYQLQALAAGLLRGKTVLFITHDPLEALRLADEIYIMNGQPATLKHIASLSTEAPRELDNKELTSLQPILFNALTKTEAVA